MVAPISPRDDESPVSPDGKKKSDKLRARDALVFELCDGLPIGGHDLVKLYEKIHGPCEAQDRSQLILSLSKQGLRNDKPRGRRYRKKKQLETMYPEECITELITPEVSSI